MGGEHDGTTRGRSWLPWALLAAGFACSAAIVVGAGGRDRWIGGPPLMVLGMLVPPTWGVVVLLLAMCALWVAGARRVSRRIPWFVHGLIGVACAAAVVLALTAAFLATYDVSSHELVQGSSQDGCRVVVETTSMHRTGGQYEGRLHVVDAGAHSLRATGTAWHRDPRLGSEPMGAWSVRWEGKQGTVTGPEGVGYEGSPVMDCR